MLSFFWLFRKSSVSFPPYLSGVEAARGSKPKVQVLTLAGSQEETIIEHSAPACSYPVFQLSQVPSTMGAAECTGGFIPTALGS